MKFRYTYFELCNSEHMFEFHTF